MNYEDMSFDDFRKLALNNPQEFNKVPNEYLKKAAVDYEIEEAKKNGELIDDSRIVIFGDE